MRLPLVTPVLPRLLAPVFPITYSPRDLILAKAYARSVSTSNPLITLARIVKVSRLLPRRARTLFSVSFSRLPLSGPLPIVGLVGHYPTNNLIGR